MRNELENCQLYDFEISDEDMTRIEHLEDGVRVSLSSQVMLKSWDEIKDNDYPGRFTMS